MSDTYFSLIVSLQITNYVPFGKVFQPSNSIYLLLLIWSVIRTQLLNANNSIILILDQKPHSLPYNFSTSLVMWEKALLQATLPITIFPLTALRAPSSLQCFKWCVYTSFILPMQYIIITLLLQELAFQFGLALKI